jgi:putative ABC transport system permease protein
VMTVTGWEVSAWKAGVPSIERIETYSSTRAILTGRGEAESLDGCSISPGLLPMLGARPVAGRLFDAADAEPNATRSVMLGHRLWRERFGANPAIIGQVISLDKEPHVVIGVAPAGFALPMGDEHDFWVPQPTVGFPSAWTRPQLFVLGWLHPGATVIGAQREMDFVTSALRREDAGYAGWTGRILTVAEEIGQEKRRLALLLFGATIVTLMIGTFNAAQLLLARGKAREHDVAVRRALGASGRRLARQLVAEGLLLTTATAALAIALSAALVHLTLALRPPDLDDLNRVTLDGRVLAFGVLAAVVVNMCGALLPLTAQCRGDIAVLLQRGASRATAERTAERTRHTLVAAQIAFSLVLLVAAGQLLRSFARLVTTDVGVSSTGLALAQTSFPSGRYRDASATRRAVDQVIEKIRMLPGISSVDVTSGMPPRMTVRSGQIDLADRTLPQNETGIFYGEGAVGPAYFETAGVRLLAGRPFTADDRDGSEPVAIVGRSTARRYWPGTEAIGRVFRLNNSPRTVVGIVEDVRANAVGGAIVPLQIYFPYAQAAQRTVTFVARSRSVPPVQVAEAMRAVVAAQDSRLVVRPMTVDDLVWQALARERFTLTLISIYALVALLMAALGVASLMTFTVVQRRREIGIRVALGGTPTAVARSVAWRPIKACATGMLAGAAGSIATGRLMSHMLHDVQWLDLPTLSAGIAGIAVVSLAAVYLPACRATRRDPVTALRAE